MSIIPPFKKINKWVINHPSNRIGYEWSGEGKLKNHSTNSLPGPGKVY